MAISLNASFLLPTMSQSCFVCIIAGLLLFSYPCHESFSKQSRLSGWKSGRPAIIWQYIVEIKHPAMKGKEELVREILSDPAEIRMSRIDRDVFLYYKRFDKLYCAVVRQQGNEGFLITAYPADKVKEGEVIWTK